MGWIGAGAAAIALGVAGVWVAGCGSQHRDAAMTKSVQSEQAAGERW